jgi:hypothetical protein
VIGYWQVGRRIIGSFSEYATFGRRITIETPKIPALPTFETGFHTVRLVITRPRAYFKLPEIVYYVTSEVSEPPVGGRIDLGSPQKDASLPFAPAMFQWKKIPLVHAYLIEFREKGKTKPLFSALTREPSYTIPPAALVYFIPGKALLWTVKGFDKQGKTLAISPTRAFSFQDQ